MGQALIELVLTGEPTFKPEDQVAEDETFLDEMTDNGTDSCAGQHGTPIVGRLWELDGQGLPLVCFDGAPGSQPVPARSTVPLDSGTVGRDVVLLFERGDLAKPLIMGVLRTPKPEPIRTEIDGEKLVFTAEREIVLRCGEASITLTRAGKVLIQGAYLLTKSSGLNRIKGGSVQIN
jgi:Domain of unknown function (DUF6484)